ncbi:HEAT repeat domain-containing protein [Methanobacterium formicicum]|uniref:PBS lyase HEAT domain-containing protein n=1 Tax=Methanobacterium formicicum (strain DSM 3637 / PP1) TaxID=1204725 RepID=K2RBZ8_METFP|nr:HEAT repeat domain-containing protein [Methanobacterium formicicum]EKF85819.1 PBS lyase HEAT domain-containing protein [Methanobacterium formicicum DSM 3637]
MDSDVNVAQLEEEQDVEGLIRALKDHDYLTRKEAARALKKVGDETAVPALIEALRYKSWHLDYVILSSVRENSAEALGRIGDIRAIPALIDSMENDPDEEVRLKSAWALGELGNEGAVDALITALEDKNWSVRRTSANALGRIGDHRAVPYLIKALEDNDWHVRKYAAVSLGKMQDKQAIPILLEAMDDEDADVRWKAMLALGKLGESAVPPLVKTLKNKNWRMRAKAAEVLGKIGGEDALHALINLLVGRTTDKNRHVRGKAAEALGRIGDEEAFEALKNAQKDEYKYVRDKADVSIQKILKPRKEIRILNYDNGEVSLDYSEHWEMVETSDAKKVLRGLYANNSITLSLNRNTDVAEISSQEFAEMLKDVFRIQGSEVIDERDFEKYGMEVYEIYGENHELSPTSILIVSFKKDSLLYYLWFVGDPVAFQDASEDIEIMVDSFYIYG